MILALTSVVGCNGEHVPITDYDKGYNTGVNHVREGRSAVGPLGDFIVGLGRFAPRDSKSADWNAGYRAGVTAELKR
jgi:hypothetical protein